MEDFLQNFLKDAPKIARKLLREVADLRINESGRDEKLVGIFRRVHTLKGSSAIHNLDITSQTAHKIESIIQDIRTEKIAFNNQNIALIKEGLKNLAVSFELLKRGETAILPHKFIEKTSKLKQNKTKVRDEDLSKIFAPEILDKLSSIETELLKVAWRKNKRIFVAEISFEIAKFNRDFKSFRTEIEKKGAIIAAFPSPANPNKIGFQILFASLEKSGKLETFWKDIEFKIIFEIKKEKTPPENLCRILQQAVWEGQQIAEKIDKKINFEIECGEILVTRRQKKSLNIALLHLIRNSVDHGIESLTERKNASKSSQGNILLKATAENDKIRVQISDDGCGIDVRRVRQIATHQGLITPNETLTLEKAKLIIFSPGFSTVLSATEISGRGIGLHTAENAIQQIKGELKIDSKFGFGATFEIILPIEKMSND